MSAIGAARAWRGVQLAATGDEQQTTSVTKHLNKPSWRANCNHLCCTPKVERSVRELTRVETVGVKKSISSESAEPAQSLRFGLILVGLMACAFALFHWIDRTTDFSWPWAWWATAYLVVGAVVGLIFGVVAFFGLWIWAANRYGALGFLLGWLPAIIAAVANGYVLLVGWLPAMIVAAVMTAR